MKLDPQYDWTVTKLTKALTVSELNSVHFPRELILHVIEENFLTADRLEISLEKNIGDGIVFFRGIWYEL